MVRFAGLFCIALGVLGICMAATAPQAFIAGLGFILAGVMLYCFSELVETNMKILRHLQAAFPVETAEPAKPSRFQAIRQREPTPEPVSAAFPVQPPSPPPEPAAPSPTLWLATGMHADGRKLRLTLRADTKAQALTAAEQQLAEVHSIVRRS